MVFNADPKRVASRYIHATSLSDRGNVLSKDVLGGLPADYTGKHRVAVFSGKPRDYITGAEFRQKGILLPFSGRGASLTAPVSNWARAIAQAERVVAQYKSADPHGNTGSVVGLVYWSDHGSWSGIVSLYHSRS